LRANRNGEVVEKKVPDGTMGKKGQEQTCLQQRSGHSSSDGTFRRGVSAKGVWGRGNSLRGRGNKNYPGKTQLFGKTTGRSQK